MNDTKQKVECSVHGECEPAYVCQHLNLTDLVGFHQPYNPENPDEEELNAWCDECDKILLEEGEWNDRSEGHAKIKLVCSECFQFMKDLNTWPRP